MRLNPVIKLQMNSSGNESGDTIEPKQLLFSQNSHTGQAYQQIRLIQDQDIKEIKSLDTASPVQLQALFDKSKLENKDDQIKIVDSGNVSSSKADEIQDHIDSIINEVASGSGVIPYSSDFDDDESKFKNFQKIDLLVLNKTELNFIKSQLVNEGNEWRGRLDRRLGETSREFRKVKGSKTQRRQ